MVLHPGHDELHGITVVIRGSSGKTYVGRWHERQDRGLVMRDVATHNPATGLPLEEWLARQRKFGVAATDRLLVLPADEVQEVARLI